LKREQGKGEKEGRENIEVTGKGEKQRNGESGGKEEEFSGYRAEQGWGSGK
jgi:hypothetical protein